MNKIILVRHCKTDWNDKHLIQGSTDVELNENGKKDAENIKDKIILSEIDLCLCSPLKRAKQTAEIITDNKVDIIFDDLLKERGFGNYEGKTYNDDLVIKHWNYKLNDSSENIESIRECLERTKLFLDKVSNTYQDKTILIVTHACIIKAIHFNVTSYDENTDFLSFFPQNGGIYEYEIK